MGPLMMSHDRFPLQPSHSQPLKSPRNPAQLSQYIDALETSLQQLRSSQAERCLQLKKLTRATLDDSEKTDHALHLLACIREHTKRPRTDDEHHARREAPRCRPAYPQQHPHPHQPPHPFQPHHAAPAELGDAGGAVVDPPQWLLAAAADLDEYMAMPKTPDPAAIPPYVPSPVRANPSPTRCVWNPGKDASPQTSRGGSLVPSPRRPIDYRFGPSYEPSCNNLAQVSFRGPNPDN